MRAIATKFDAKSWRIKLLSGILNLPGDICLPSNLKPVMFLGKGYYITLHNQTNGGDVEHKKTITLPLRPETH